MRLTFLPRNLSMDINAGENVYDAASRQGFRMPVSCRNGVCEICRAELVSGEVESGAFGQNEVLVCKTILKTSSVIRMDGLYGPGELPVKELKCQVLDVSLFSVREKVSNIYRVILRMPAGKIPEFFAGQYLALNLPGRDAPCFYSIACAPRNRELELHIQADPHLASAIEVIEHLKANTVVSVNLPFGKACLSSVPDKPVIFVAAGTGFAQMKSVVEFLLANNFSHTISLYWGVRKEEEMYCNLAAEWAQQYESIDYHPSVAEIEDNQGVEHHEQLARAVMREHSDFADSLVFVSGSPRLVYSVMDTLVAADLPETQFFSDVLEYAPRGQV